jgi:hypothetical protein
MWAGWYRPNSESGWRRIVTADSEDEAFNRLLDIVRGGDKIVLPFGRDPNNGGWDEASR